MKLINWISGFFADQNGKPSQKRLIGYIAMFFLGLIVNGSLAGKNVDQQVLFVIGGLVMFSVGAVTGEYFKK